MIPLQPEDGPGSAGECAIHPAGRLLATPTLRGLLLSDLATGRRLAFLTASGLCRSPRFDSDGSLFAVAGRRAVRWPTIAAGNRIRFGPAERLNLPAGENLDISSDGRFVGMAAINQSAVLDRQTSKVTMLEPQRDVRHVAVHPDGSLVASFGFGSAGFRLSTTDSGKPVEFAGTATVCAAAFFTPDGGYVITWHGSLPQLQLWSMPDCKLVRELGAAAHSASARTAAMSPSRKPTARFESRGSATGR